MPFNFNMFARSPLRALEEHMLKAHACAQALVVFFDAVTLDNWDLAETIRQRIDDLESEADDLKRDLRIHLPKGLFLPVRRSDILQLLSMQERVADCAEAIANLISGRRLQIPAGLSEAFKAYLRRAVDASTQANKAINELSALLDTGFQGNEITLMEGMIHELDRIERDTDDMQTKLRAELFKLERELMPMHAIFLYKAIEWIGDLADRAQSVGKYLQLLMAR